MSDGCIYLLREMSLVGEKATDLVIKNLQSLADLGYVDHFKHSQNMKENLFKSLKEMVSSPQGLGKKKYRPYIEIFLDPAFRNGQESQTNNDYKSMNMTLAAQDFILSLAKVYGEGIFKGILEGHDDRYVQRYIEFKGQAMSSGLPHFGQKPFG